MAKAIKSKSSKATKTVKSGKGDKKATEKVVMRL
jgi:hypothetical protein